MISIPVPTFLLAFDERKIKKKNQMTVLESKTNMYIVLCRNSFHYCVSPKFPVPLNPDYTFPFEGNSCQINSFCYFGSPTFPVPLNPNSTFPFEDNFCSFDRNSCQLP